MDSFSENRGLALLSQTDTRIYSVGISTGGMAEIRMAAKNPNCHIIATTIDPAGAEYAKKQIQQALFSDQIAVCIEDVAQPLPYPDKHFHIIYARLVLHYLPKQHLIQSLNELHRILVSDGKLFIVVRSCKCLDAQQTNAVYDSKTCMTTYFSKGLSLSRHFHTEESIQGYLTDAGFSIENITSYEELLCCDFQRTQPSEKPDDLIEVLARKTKTRNESL